MSAVAYFFTERMLERAERNDWHCWIAMWAALPVSCWMSRETLRSTKGEQHLSAIEGLSEASSEGMHERVARTILMRGTLQLAPLIRQCPWPPPLTNSLQFRPTGPFEAMVERITPFGARGVLWYKVRKITPYANDCAVLLHCMINQWRATWGANRLLLRNFRNL